MVWASKYKTIFREDGNIEKIVFRRKPHELLGWGISILDNLYYPIIWDDKRGLTLLDRSTQYQEPFFDDETGTWWDMNAASFLIVGISTKRPSRRAWKEAEAALVSRAMFIHSPETSYADHILSEIENNHWLDAQMESNQHDGGGRE
jgi:hypothetical protein